jgi:hypothetical protein
MTVLKAHQPATAEVSNLITEASSGMDVENTSGLYSLSTDVWRILDF